MCSGLFLTSFKKLGQSETLLLQLSMAEFCPMISRSTIRLVMLGSKPIPNGGIGLGFLSDRHLY